MTENQCLFEIEKKTNEEGPGETPKRDFFKVKNKWWDAICRYRIPGEQRQVLDFIIRMTYGYQEKKAPIAIQKFSECTGMPPSSVCRALSQLSQKNLIFIDKNANSIVATYRFNKYYDTWKTLTKTLTKPAKNRMTNKNKRIGNNVDKNANGNPLTKTLIGVDKKVNANLQKGKRSVDENVNAHLLYKDNKDNLKTHTKDREKSVRGRDGLKGFPKDFKLTEEQKNYSIEEGIDPQQVDAFFADFKYWAIAKNAKYHDWDAAYKLRVNNAPKYGIQFMKKQADDDAKDYDPRWMDKLT